MRTTDIPNKPDFDRGTFSLADLLERSSSDSRSSWVDLPRGTGIYVVYWSLSEEPVFQHEAGRARFAKTTDPTILEREWKRINKRLQTDIIYIGKSTNIRGRVIKLARFGAGKDRRHKGGEEMWQISKIQTANVLLQRCPPGNEIAFENWLLEKFGKEHEDWPIANRDGPESDERWWPGKVEK